MNYWHYTEVSCSQWNPLKVTRVERNNALEKGWDCCEVFLVWGFGGVFCWRFFLVSISCDNLESGRGNQRFWLKVPAHLLSFKNYIYSIITLKTDQKVSCRTCALGKYLVCKKGYSLLFRMTLLLFGSVICCPSSKCLSLFFFFF